MPKGHWLIPIAAFIDFVSVFISWLCIALGATAGTTGAAAAAYTLCSGAGITVASACALAGGALGTIIDPAIATVGIPLGIALGDAITVCLTIMGLSLLIMPMLMMGMFYPKYLFFDLGKLVPILNWFPFLTAFVIGCVATKYAEEKRGSLLANATKIALVVGGTGFATAYGLKSSVENQRRAYMPDIRPPQRN